MNTTLENHPHPEPSLLIIEAKRISLVQGLKSLWQFRELLYFLTWRDVKVRYKQTVLGAAWAILQPLFTMVLFTIFFGRLARIPSDNIPYPLFAYAGLMPWMFFSGAILNSGNSLIGNAHMITKIYFPRMIIPGAAVLAGLVDFVISFAIFAGLMVWYRVPVGPGILLLPFLLLLTALLALGVGMWLSALNVEFRDIRYAIPFLVQIWMFMTPIIYPSSLMPEKYRLVYAINPMAGIVEAFRAALLGRVNGAGIDWVSLNLSCLLSILMLLAAALHFHRMERTFADLI